MLLDDLLLDLDLKILNVVDVLHQFFEVVLPSSEELLNLLLVLLHPTHQVLLLPCLLLLLLLLQQATVEGLCVSEVLLIDGFAQLGCCLFRSYGDFSFVDVFDSRKVLRRTKVSVPSEAWDFSALGIIHLSIFDGPVIISSKLLDPDLPIVKLPEQSIDIIIQCSNFILGPCSVLNLLYFFDDISSDLLPPSLALIKISDLPDMPDPLGSLIVLLVDEGALHRPPPVQHSLCLLAVSCH